MTTTKRSEQAAQYIAAGFALCATREEDQKQAYGKGWQTAGRLPSHWEAKPGDGVGLIHALSGTCSIDVDSVKQARIALEAVGLDLDQLLSGGVQINSGRPDRAKLLFKAPADLPQKRHALNWPVQGDPSRKECVIELRAGNVHDVLPPSIHPDTGLPYQWHGNWQELPELPPELAKLWHQWPLAKDAMQDACPWGEKADSRAPANATLAPRHVSGEHGDVIGHYNRATDINELLLQHGYRKAGKRWMAPNSSTGIPGVVRLPDSEPLMVYSFHGSDPLSDGHAHDAFSIYCQLAHRGDISAAVAQAADDLGILPPVDHEAAEIAARIMGKTGDNVAEIALAKKQPVTPERLEAPEAGAMPVYLLDQARAWLAGQVHNAKDDAVTQTLLAFMCAMTSRRYETTSGQPTTTFFGISDSSTAGIRPLRDAVYRLCRDVGERRLIRGTGISGAHVIYQSLLAYPRIFWATDLYGTMIMRTKRQTSGGIESALGVIHEIYTGQTLFIDPDTATSGKPRNINECDIYAPSFTMLAMLGNAQVSALTSRTEYARGTLQQMLLIPAGDNGHENWEIKNDALPAGIIEHVKRLADLQGMAGTTDNATQPPQLTKVQWLPDVADVFKDAHARFMAIMDTPEREEFRGMAHGYLQSVIRLASAMAAWESPEVPRISVPIAQWCAQWAERCLVLSMPRIENSGGEEEQTVQELVLDVLREAKEPLSERDIRRKCRALRNLPAGDREAILTGLAEDGQVLSDKVGKSTKFVIARLVK